MTRAWVVKAPVTRRLTRHSPTTFAHIHDREGREACLGCVSVLLFIAFAAAYPRPPGLLPLSTSSNTHRNAPSKRTRSCAHTQMQYGGQQRTATGRFKQRLIAGPRWMRRRGGRSCWERPEERQGRGEIGRGAARAGHASGVALLESAAIRADTCDCEVPVCFEG